MPVSGGAVREQPVAGDDSQHDSRHEAAPEREEAPFPAGGRAARPGEVSRGTVPSLPDGKAPSLVSDGFQTHVSLT